MGVSRQQRAAVAVVWVLSRILLLWLLHGRQEWVNGDVGYFDASITALRDLGLAHTLVEYPLPAVAVVGAPWLAVHALDGLVPYAVLVQVASVLLDAAFVALLLRVGRGPLAAWVWVVGVPLLGVVTFARFDLVPGVLCGVAVLVLARHPRSAALAVTVATAVKMWPALAIPPLLARARPRTPAVAVVAAGGLVLAGGTVLLAGFERLVSPLTYQGHRGLQIESVLATPAVVGWWREPLTWQIWYAPSKSYEIVGPLVGVMLSASTVLTAAYVALLALAWWSVWRLRDVLSAASMVWLVLASVTGFVVVGKVFSPQYLLWLLPVAAAGLAVVDSPPLRRWTAGLLLAAGLTQLVFPVSYGQLTGGGTHEWTAVLPLVARNVVVVLLMFSATAAAFRSLRADAQRGSALERQPPGPAWSGERTSR